MTAGIYTHYRAKEASRAVLCLKLRASANTTACCVPWAVMVGPREDESRYRVRAEGGGRPTLQGSSTTLMQLSFPAGRFRTTLAPGKRSSMGHQILKAQRVSGILSEEQKRNYPASDVALSLPQLDLFVEHVHLRHSTHPNPGYVALVCPEAIRRFTSHPLVPTTSLPRCNRPRSTLASAPSHENIVAGSRDAYVPFRIGWQGIDTPRLPPLADRHDSWAPLCPQASCSVVPFGPSPNLEPLS